MIFVSICGNLIVKYIKLFIGDMVYDEVNVIRNLLFFFCLIRVYDVVDCCFYFDIFGKVLFIKLKYFKLIFFIIKFIKIMILCYDI